MALLIDNDVTARVLETADAVEALEQAFRQVGEGDATFQPRTDIVSPTATDGDAYVWGSMLGATVDPPRLALRFKSDVLSWDEHDGNLVEEKFNVEPGVFMGFILLMDTTNGELLALLNDGELQHVRVGATAGVACDHLARRDADTVGILGSGGMARTYVEAFATVRDLSMVRVYSPTQANREAYAEEMDATLDATVRAVESPKDAVRDAGIVAACTDARHPVFSHEWVDDSLLAEGAFITNTTTVEIDDRTFTESDRVLTTTNAPYQPFTMGEIDQEEYEQRRGKKGFTETDYDELSDLLNDKVIGRQSDDDVVFYDNSSAGVQFAAVGDLVYQRASERGLGTEVPLSWFQQDIRN